MSIHLIPGEKNPIEGKFGQAKNGYGLSRIRARLKETSETWIASIILVLNLVKLAGLSILLLPVKLLESFSVYELCAGLVNHDKDRYRLFIFQKDIYLSNITGIGKHDTYTRMNVA